jgi:hypothetical protein
MIRPEHKSADWQSVVRCVVLCGCVCVCVLRKLSKVNFTANHSASEVDTGRVRMPFVRYKTLEVLNIHFGGEITSYKDIISIVIPFFICDRWLSAIACSI